MFSRTQHFPGKSAGHRLQTPDTISWWKCLLNTTITPLFLRSDVLAVHVQMRGSGNPSILRIYFLITGLLSEGSLCVVCDDATVEAHFCGNASLVITTYPANGFEK